MEGFYNARDLGGMPTLDGGRTRRGVFVRCADPRFVTATGWGAAWESGFRTLVDLRNPDEGEPFEAPGFRREQIPLDDIVDQGFWREIGDLVCCPLYYPPFLERKSERCAAAITALARAEPGVVFHCRGGRDRTGLIAILLLALAGVTREAIVEDYLRSTAALGPFFARVREPDQRPLIDAVVAREGTTLPAAVEATLDGLDAEQYLRAAGVAEADLATLRTRLAGGPETTTGAPPRG